LLKVQIGTGGTEMTILLAVIVSLTLFIGNIVIKIYKILGQDVPAVFYKAIKSTQNKQNKIVKPQDFISPKIDGTITDFFEWKNSRYYEIGHAGDSMHQTSTILKSFNFGFDIKNFYLKLALNEQNIVKLLEEYTFNLIFIRPVEVKVVLKIATNKHTKKYHYCA
jgi:hypothetical protein